MIINRRRDCWKTGLSRGANTGIILLLVVAGSALFAAGDQQNYNLTIFLISCDDKRFQDNIVSLDGSAAGINDCTYRLIVVKEFKLNKIF